MIRTNVLKWTSNNLIIKASDSLVTLHSKLTRLEAVKASLLDKIESNKKMLTEKKGNVSVVVGITDYYDEVGMRNAKIKLKQVEKQIEQATKFIQEKEQQNA